MQSNIKLNWYLKYRFQAYSRYFGDTCLYINNSFLFLKSYITLYECVIYLRIHTFIDRYWFCLFFGDRKSLCSLGWLPAHSDPLASASQILELQAGTTMPGDIVVFNFGIFWEKVLWVLFCYSFLKYIVSFENISKHAFAKSFNK